MRPYLNDSDPLLVVTAACALAESVERSGSRRGGRRAAAARVRHARAGRPGAARSRPVARSGAQSALPAAAGAADVRRGSRRRARSDPERGTTRGRADFLFVPPLVSLMRNRLLKGAARQVLVGYGEPLVDTLAYFLKDKDEDIWIRRHVPSTLGLIPSQRSLDVLTEALENSDGFVRYKAGGAIERIRRDRPDLQIDQRGRRAPDPAGGDARVQRADAASQPVRDRRPRYDVGAGSGADREARARDRPDLPPARPAPLAGGHRRRPDRARAVAMRDCAPARPSTSTTC